MAKERPDIDIREIGKDGVNVDDALPYLRDTEVRQAQNAVRGAEGNARALTQRPGVKKASAAAAIGRILGAITVPLGRISGGRRNTWGWGGQPGNDADLEWRTWLEWPDWGIFGDIGWWDWWDWWLSDDRDPLTESPDPTTEPDPDPADVDNTTPRTLFITRNGGGSAGGSYRNWFRGRAAFTDPVTIDTTTLQWGVNDFFVDAMVAGDTSGKPSIGIGSPAQSCVLNGRVYYPGWYDVSAYDPDDITTHPSIRVFDGRVDRHYAYLPLPPASSGDDVMRVHSMLANGSTVFVAVSTDSSGNDPGDGRVYYLGFNPVGGGMIQLGANFVGEWPYALCWHLGRLWVGTFMGSPDQAKLYSFRPGVDSVDAAYTLEHTVAGGNEWAIVSMCSYRGSLFFGTAKMGGVAFAHIYKRDPVGTITTARTGTGAAAADSSGFYSMVVFNGNLYASYYNDTGRIATIQKFDGTTWSTVFTGATTQRHNLRLIVNGKVLYAVGGQGVEITVLISLDGSAWTDKSAQFSDTAGPYPFLFAITPYGVEGPPAAWKTW